MTLQAEGNLRLALPAERNNFVENLVGTLILIFALQWPFAQVARRAVEERPDLVIHVGDYLYREVPCPADKQTMCGGTPSGDTWDAWNADFFTPAAKLLATAPWAFSRGNHEDCGRSWRSWFYYLDPRPWNGT